MQERVGRHSAPGLCPEKPPAAHGDSGRASTYQVREVLRWHFAMAHFETLIVGEAEHFQPAQKGVVLLIPAYKPSASLPELIRSVREYDSSGIIAAVLVVDDGSGPEFGPVFRAAKTEAGAIVISHAVNLGKGAALKSGFNHALLRWTTASGIVTADADGQHAPRDILRVASELSEHPDQLVLGARKFTSGVPFRSRFGKYDHPPCLPGIYRSRAG